MTSENHTSAWVWPKLLCLTVIATLVFEHSQLDVRISELFYTNGQWLIQKGAQPYVFLFYDLPKGLLIVLAVYLISVLTIKYRRSLNTNSLPPLHKGKFDRLLIPLSGREISYLLMVLIVVPTTIALLKDITHVSCPTHLAIFNGDLSYLNIWQNMRAETPKKCFPAAHASAGFSLYGLAFLPTLHRQRYRVFEIVTILGWTMGIYKTSIGDHFFSHTLVSMLLSLTLACGLANMFFIFKSRGSYGSAALR